MNNINGFFHREKYIYMSGTIYFYLSVDAK